MSERYQGDHPIIKTKMPGLAEVFSKYKGNLRSFYEPSKVDPRYLLELERLAFQELPDGFKPVDLSPIVPAGLLGNLTIHSPPKVLSIPHRGDVIYDGSIILAFQASLEMKGNQGKPIIERATAARIVRGQNFSEIPGFSQHFKSLELVTLGKNGKDKRQFEFENTKKHLEYYLRLINKLKESGLIKTNKIKLLFSNLEFTEYLIKSLKSEDRYSLGRETQNREFSLLKKLNIEIDPIVNEKYIEGVLAKIKALYKDENNFFPIFKLFKSIKEGLVLPLKDQFSNVEILFDLDRLAGIGYYKNLCAHIFLTNNDGIEYPIVDLGTTKWGEKLMSNKHFGTVVSGMGTELLLNNFMDK